jgi:cytochrome P450
MRIQQRAISSTAAFAVKQTAGYESLVRKVADKLLSGLPDSGEVDIVDAFTMGPLALSLTIAPQQVPTPPVR